MEKLVSRDYREEDEGEYWTREGGLVRGEGVKHLRLQQDRRSSQFRPPCRSSSVLVVRRPKV